VLTPDNPFSFSGKAGEGIERAHAGMDQDMAYQYHCAWPHRAPMMPK
jgi:hypothetical protein